MLDLKITESMEKCLQTMVIKPHGRNHFSLTSALGSKLHTQKF
jgi:hypothetical protein